VQAALIDAVADLARRMKIQESAEEPIPTWDFGGVS
jgi:hypothetical protein